MFKIPINPRSLDRVARTAASHQILRILLPLLRARNNKVHPHHQRILKTSPSIQPAILAAVIVPLQNRQAFLQTCRLINQRKRRYIQRHEPPPNRKSLGRSLKWECADSRLSFGKTIGHHSVTVKPASYLWSAGLRCLPWARGVLPKRCVVKSMSYPRRHPILTATIRTRRAARAAVAKTSHLSLSVKTLICGREQFTQ